MFQHMLVCANQVMQSSHRCQLGHASDDDNEYDRASLSDASMSTHSNDTDSSSDSECLLEQNNGGVTIMPDNNEGRSSMNEESNTENPLTIDASIFRMSKYE